MFMFLCVFSFHLFFSSACVVCVCVCVVGVGVFLRDYCRRPASRVNHWVRNFEKKKNYTEQVALQTLTQGKKAHAGRKFKPFLTSAFSYVDLEQDFRLFQGI